ncbi:MAG TPA: hypothetical protein VE978_09955 [Chitinophagales bacterium]|nr:hypothetical protein [Chitinophagales bacterium]
MRRHFFSLEAVIGIATGFMLLYLLSILFEFPGEWVLNLWLLSPFVIVWMMIRILKDPCTTDKNFDEYFYQDRDDLRRNGKESSDLYTPH